MPKRPPDTITMGFLGTGAMEVNTATDLIEEYVNENMQGDESVHFVFPLTTNEFTDTMGDLVNMARASEITYEVVRSNTDKERRAFQEIASHASKIYDVPDVFTQMEVILADAPRAILMVLWDAERDQELTEICSKFIDADIDTRDLTDGMTRLGNEAEDSAGLAPEPDETGEEEEEGGEEIPTFVQEAPTFTREHLEKKSRDEIKVIAQGMGLAPRRSSAAMIDEILAAQESQIAPDSPVVPEEPPVAVEAVDTTTVALAVSAAALDAWTDRLSSLFDDFLNRLDKVEIKIATPPPIEEVPAAPRRLSRRA